MSPLKADCEALAQACPHIVGIKEAGGDADHVSFVRPWGLSSPFSVAMTD